MGLTCRGLEPETCSYPSGVELLGGQIKYFSAVLMCRPSFLAAAFVADPTIARGRNMAEPKPL